MKAELPFACEKKLDIFPITRSQDSVGLVGLREKLPPSDKLCSC